MVLFGFNFSDLKDFFTDYVFLSAWMQAIGSLAAVWATYSIYKLSAKESEERERRKEKKLEIEMEETKKAAAERHALMAKVEFLSDEKLREFLHDIYYMTGYHRITMLNFCTNPIDKVSGDFYSYLNSLIKTTQPLNKDMLRKLVDIHGEEAIELQQTLMRISSCVNKLQDLLLGFGHSKTNRELSGARNSEEENLKLFNNFFQEVLKKFEDNMIILDKKINIISVYARFN